MGDRVMAIEAKGVLPRMPSIREAHFRFQTKLKAFYSMVLQL
jgi:hypothetical protein